MGIFDRSSRGDSASDGPTDTPVVAVREGLLNNLNDITDRFVGRSSVSMNIDGLDARFDRPGGRGSFGLTITDRYPESESLRDAGRRYTIRADGRADVAVFGRFLTPYRMGLSDVGVPRQGMSTFDFEFEAITTTDQSAIPLELMVAVNDVAESFRDERPVHSHRATLRSGPRLSSSQGYYMSVNGVTLDQWDRDRGSFPAGGDPVFRDQHTWESEMVGKVLKAVQTRGLEVLAERVSHVKQMAEARERGR